MYSKYSDLIRDILRLSIGMSPHLIVVVGKKARFRELSTPPPRVNLVGMPPQQLIYLQNQTRYDYDGDDDDPRQSYKCSSRSSAPFHLQSPFIPELSSRDLCSSRQSRIGVLCLCLCLCHISLNPVCSLFCDFIGFNLARKCP